MKWAIKRSILVFFLVALVCILGACGKSVDTIQSEFEEMLTGEITPEKLVSTAAYLDKYIGKLDEERASRMLVDYEDYALRYMNSEVDKTLLEEMKGYYAASGKSRELIKNIDELQSFDQAMQNADIIVSLQGDQIKLTLDYRQLSSDYQKYILPEVYHLYQIKALEAEKPCIQNATLLLSWEDLVQRAYQVELLMAQYTDGKLIASDLKSLYEMYMNFVLIGANNTPIFDYETMQFSEVAKKEYSSFIEKNPDTITGWILEEYFSYLDENGYQLNYKNKTESKAFFDHCSWLITEAEKRVKK
ncbi:hypothetical protein [Sinanaerobacter sp. ZZT-01]|uniref:hypothetical protein n=1 Tax=Sinanaerobacter sp. ZZT-01 TaxID=3111540 RepID=UPI002D78206E|nr:hypothetical protein [Sinanaerobacter sp. ZZT-01]WRR92105.1 hypothetical protein U5921_08460 [Sinanaerobacter sp. ZZT-01]